MKQRGDINAPALTNSMQTVVLPAAHAYSNKEIHCDFFRCAKSDHIWRFQVWHSSDQPIDIKEYPIIKEKTPQLYFITITSHWAKR